jgi:hypothetical protein
LTQELQANAKISAATHAATALNQPNNLVVCRNTILILDFVLGERYIGFVNDGQKGKANTFDNYLHLAVQQPDHFRLFVHKGAPPDRNA